MNDNFIHGDPDKFTEEDRTAYWQKNKGKINIWTYGESHEWINIATHWRRWIYSTMEAQDAEYTYQQNTKKDQGEERERRRLQETWT